ncbi:MAG: indole-3-glycerol phosphate synthase TrpC [Acidobacteria bacterium]|nr:indole-3-glycerol phosphate synthase TrpC [Acidobacteriota bacterium]
MENILDRILERKRERLAAARSAVPLEQLQSPPRSRPVPRRFEQSLRQAGVNIIAEIKRRSPSKGVIREDFNPVSIARAYTDHGACAISCLTEEDFFDGSLENLRQVRSVTALPILRKDFIFDRYQLFEAWHAGADAVLLIAAMLEPSRFSDLLEESYSLGLDVLVEVHDQSEMEMVMAFDTRILGINNRNLRTFATTLQTSLELAAELPDSVTLVSESGIRTRADIGLLRQAGFNGFLIGEELMRSPDVGAALVELRSE